MDVNAENDFLTPAPLVNDASFKRMCSILELTEDERKLARIAIASYEAAKQRHDGHH